MRNQQDTGASVPDRVLSPTATEPVVSAHSGNAPSRGLTALERRTLSAWENCSVGYGFGFKTASEQSGTPAYLIRRVVRSLARKGMLEYSRALFWEDEPKMGAGYTLTDLGQEAISDACEA